MISPTVNLADIGVKFFETAGHFVSLLIATSITLSISMQPNVFLDVILAEKFPAINLYIPLGVGLLIP